MGRPMTATGGHMPYGITQFYLPPDTRELAPMGVATGVDIGIYTPKISPSKLFVG